MNTIDATTRQQYRRHLWQAGGKAAGWWHAALGVPRGCAGKECAARKLIETETVNGTDTLPIMPGRVPSRDESPARGPRVVSVTESVINEN